MFFSKLETFIAFRYLRSRRKESFISLSAWFSLIGIMLGVATLIVVMSVMNGFRTELVNRILGINGHLEIYSNNASHINDYNRVIKKIINVEDVVAVTPQIEGQALARSKDYVTGVIVRGVRWTDLPTKKLLWDSLSKQSKYNYEKNNETLIYSPTHLHILQVPLTKIEVLDSLGESKVSGTATQNILESA